MTVRVVFAWKRAALIYPVPPAPRTAVLVPWLRPTESRSKGVVRVFDRGWCAEAAAFRPAAIAATWPQLESLLSRDIEPPTHSLIVLARSVDQLLTPAQRQQLWQVFRVPIFEQLIGGHGVLLAAECEAHAGLHFESSRFNPGDRPVETNVCGCGGATPRLRAESRIAKSHTAASAR